MDKQFDEYMRMDLVSKQYDEYWTMELFSIHPSTCNFADSATFIIDLIYLRNSLRNIHNFCIFCISHGQLMSLWCIHFTLQIEHIVHLRGLI